jgi:hypothetical protein
MKKLILFLIVLSTINLNAQGEKKLELSVGSKLLFPISDDWDEDYLIGVSTGLGFVLSPQTILSVSIAYLALISNEESNENWAALPGLTLSIKRIFSIKDSTIKPYLGLETGLFIPITESYVSVFPELCGSMGLEFLIDRKTSLYFDVGYMLGIATENTPKLISGNVGVNFKI